jgi:hypothetical protein
MRNDLGTIKTDVGKIQTDVKELKAGMENMTAELKADIVKKRALHGVFRGVSPWE